jgi:hypothetical protein
MHMRNNAGKRVTIADVFRAQLSKLKRDLYVATFPFRKEAFLRKKIVACVFSIGERTEEESILSIRRQKLPVSRIEVIRNVSPISAASNCVFDVACDADYVLWVDADMILYENCTEYLIRLANTSVLWSVGGLIDPVFGVVGYVKLLNMALTKSLGIRFRNVLRCDNDFYKQAKQKDSSIIAKYGAIDKILGTHHCSYTAEELFAKTQIWRKKKGNRIDRTLLRSLTDKYCQTGNTVFLAGILGTVLPNPDDSPGESSPKSGLENWDAVSTLLKDGLVHRLFELPNQQKAPALPTNF